MDSISDKVAKYRAIARNIITELGNRKGKRKYFDIEYHTIIDDDTGNYILLRSGWKETSRFYAVLIHIEVKESGMVWLHEDRTDYIIADMLLETGISKSEIVLGFHPPIVRPETGYAVA
ncbi:MAG: XisI protein [Chitinophagales bacterium]